MRSLGGRVERGIERIYQAGCKCMWKGGGSDG